MISASAFSDVEYHKHAELRITDISNFVSDDWIKLAHELGFQSTDIAQIQKEHPDSSGQQCMSMLNLWLNEISAPDSGTRVDFCKSTVHQRFSQMSFYEFYTKVIQRKRYLHVKLNDLWP